MAATWIIDDVRFVNQAKREVTVSATRTEGATSKPYRLASFIVREGVPLSDEGDRLVADLKAVADADPSWGTPDLNTMFPNAAAILAGKLDALEAG